MQRAPIAYIRRSVVRRNDPGDISRDVQMDIVRTLAGTNDLTIIDSDWGKSGANDETDKRLGFLELIASIERREVSTLYAYLADRLARSVEWSARILNACERAGTDIVTSEGRFDPSNDLSRSMFHQRAIENENYSRRQKRQGRDNAARLRARGVKLGQPYYGKLPGEDLPAVLAAFDEAGSYMGAARLLNQRGVPSRRGHWGGSSIHRIVVRERGRMTTVRGAKARADHVFYRLLRCHCGRVLTGSRRSGGTTVYRCIRAENEVGHGKQSVAERPILEWAEREVARLRPPAEDVVLADVEAERHALAARLELVKTGFLAGLMDEAEMRSRKADIDDALMRLDLAGQVVRVPPFVWGGSPRSTNLDLRVLWDHVQLDANLRPLRAEWLLPADWLEPPASE